jgi:hypothetical protein
VYAEPALIPACKWLDSAPPEKPRLSVAAGNPSVKLSWENAPGEKAALWILQYQRGRHVDDANPAGQPTVRTFSMV